MITEERIKNWKLHNSMRGVFSFELYKAMAKNPNIILLVGDLGYLVFNNHRDDMPKQFYNAGAAEQAMMGMAVGLAMEGKIPFVYSITPFLLYRPFETIRNYINHEKIPVKMIGSGRNKDYVHDGFSHWAEEDGDIMSVLTNIKCVWPNEKEEIPAILRSSIMTKDPVYINLKR